MGADIEGQLEKLWPELSSYGAKRRRTDRVLVGLNANLEGEEGPVG